ncbi:MAG: EamA family transporter [Bryobacterales bacterium]|nr:EamA family transporter [Bryobacterales bacterium]
MPRHPQFQAYLALAAVCIFWGTTYLGIRIALESIAPAVLLSLRYTLSGGILLIAAYFSKAHIPTGRELRHTALFGVIIIGMGTGSLVFAEQWVPSGLAAVFITVSPFWMVGMEALIPGGDPLYGPTIAGMIVGLAGTVLLVTPETMQEGFGGPLLRGFLLLQLGAAGWAFGSILQRRHQTRAHPVVSGAVQQLATGLAFAVPAFLAKPHPSTWSTRSLGAVAYLVVFGSIVGYSAYSFALDRLPISVVSIYTYINPVIAIFLGWIFFREHIGALELFAMLIIFAGVALVKRYSRQSSPKPVRASAAS